MDLHKIMDIFDPKSGRYKKKWIQEYFTVAVVYNYKLLAMLIVTVVEAAGKYCSQTPSPQLFSTPIYRNSDFKHQEHCSARYRVTYPCYVALQKLCSHIPIIVSNIAPKI